MTAKSAARTHNGNSTFLVRGDRMSCQCWGSAAAAAAAELAAAEGAAGEETASLAGARAQPRRRPQQVRRGRAPAQGAQLRRARPRRVI